MTPRAVVALLLQTLRLRGDVDVADLRRHWAALDPAGLAALLQYEGCVLWVHQRLRELQLLELAPPPFAGWLTAQARRLTARNLLVDAQRDALVRILNELQVPHVLLKGAARRLLTRIYPYVGARATSDVDVLVPQEAARPTWVHLQTVGFVPTPDPARRYDGHFHLPPLENGKAVAVELHTSTSKFVPAPIAWRRLHDNARVVACRGGPTRVPSATELLWGAVTHAPIPYPAAFRMRYFHDATVGWAAGPEVDWGEIDRRLASPEVPNDGLTRRWLGTAAQLCGSAGGEPALGTLPHLDLGRALNWRLAVFRLVGDSERGATGSVWGRQPLSRGRRLLIDEATRVELHLPHSPPRHVTALHRPGRRVAAAAARLCYRGWRMLHNGFGPAVPPHGTDS